MLCDRLWKILRSLNGCSLGRFWPASDQQSGYKLEFPQGNLTWQSDRTSDFRPATLSKKRTDEPISQEHLYTVCYSTLWNIFGLAEKMHHDRIDYRTGSGRNIATKLQCKIK
jgi:hypothetical protein